MRLRATIAGPLRAGGVVDRRLLADCHAWCLLLPAPAIIVMRMVSVGACICVNAPVIRSDGALFVLRRLVMIWPIAGHAAASPMTTDPSGVTS